MPVPILAIVGPTASGKSSLAVDVAELLGGPQHAEIVNADAMQLYRGMDIGTAKLTTAERRGLAHHQLDVLDVTDEASVAAYQHHARADLEAIDLRARQPILVGGSGLYVRAALDDLQFPGTDPQLRAQLHERGQEEGPAVLHADLAGKDPAAAKKILPTNLRRIVRALEVLELTGKPFSASLPSHRYLRPALQVAIATERRVLDERIATRARAMVEAGLIEETRGLLEAGLARGPTAARAVGYAQAIDVIEGRRTIAEAIESMSVATRQLARRQEKWFCRDPRITWLPPGPGLVERVVQLLAEAMPD